MNKKWVSQESGSWGSGYDEVDGKKNILEQGMTWLNDYELMPKEISDVLKYFHTENFTKKLIIFLKKSLLYLHYFSKIKQNYHIICQYNNP